MALATFKDLVIDAADPARLGRFWADLLGRKLHLHDDGDAAVQGPTPQHTIWVNRVPEAKTVKQRVHFDIYARTLADLEALGSWVVEPLVDAGAKVLRPKGDGGIGWTLMADPEGNEFCVFTD